MAEIKESNEEKIRNLEAECGNLQDQIASIREKESQIFKAAPMLKDKWEAIETAEITGGKPPKGTHWSDPWNSPTNPETGKPELYLMVPDNYFSKGEKLAKQEIKKLRDEIAGKERLISVKMSEIENMHVEAAIKGTPIAALNAEVGHKGDDNHASPSCDADRPKSQEEAPSISSNQPNRSEKKPGPHGPWKQTIVRRPAIVLLDRQGITGQKACKKLTEMGIPLPSEKLQEIYKGDWVQWFLNDSKGFQRQWSADLKRSNTPLSPK